MRIDEFASILRMPVEDMVSIGEKQAVNPSSQIYKAIKLEIGKKFAAVKSVNDVDKKKREKNRVYIQHVVSTSDRYKFTSTFPQWEIKFANAGIRSAPTARAVYTLMTEYLFSKVRAVKGTVLVWGMDMRTIVMRSRDWVHLCVPGQEMATQYDFLTEDRSVVAMVNAACARGRDPGLAKKYALNEKTIHCTKPTTCKHVSPVALMMLHRTDTNLRQIATYMHNHSTKLLYYVIPGGKNLELCTEGEIPELDAYAFPSDSGDRIDVVYRQDQSLTHSYTYSNYLELVARTEVRMYGKIFRKEIDNSILGTLCYKVTCFDDTGDLISTSTLYRSWVDLQHNDNYMVYAPVLKTNGSVSNPDHWSMYTFPITRSVIDDVHDSAMRAQGVHDMYQFISRRLNSKTSNTVVLNQIVQRNKLMVVSRFDLVVLVIYVSVLTRKYADGKAVATLAPHARDVAEMSRHGTLGLFSVYIRAMFQKNTAGLSELMSEIRKFYYTSDTEKDLPIPAFMLEPGYVVYDEGSSSNPRFKSWNTPDGNPTYGFTASLPGVFLSNANFDEIIGHVTVDMVSDQVSESIDPMLFATGNALVKSQYALDVNTRTKWKLKHVDMCETSIGFMGMIGTAVNFVNQLVEDSPDLEQLQVEKIKFEKTDNDGFYEPAVLDREELLIEKSLPVRKIVKSQTVDEVVNKVLNDNRRIVLTPQYHAYETLFGVGMIPEVIEGASSGSPLEDLRDGLNVIFPGSLLMNTQFFESDRAYGDSKHLLKGPQIKIDLSKMAPLKPEKFFLPIIRGHVLPDVKRTPQNVLHMLEKRNANTPDSSIPMDEQRVLDSAYKAYLQVFCRVGAEEYLNSLPYIGPDEAAVSEWVSRLSEMKRKKLAGQDGYSVQEIELSRNLLMMKPKLKPNLGASYATSVKAPQGIQYDGTGKSTATLSPVIGRKVEREQSVLKHNVLILQRKSVDDIVKFLNQFDWRPNKFGKRYYIEGDYEAFDKSQGILASKLHWHKCVKFGILPELVTFLKQQNMTRSISEVEVGVKMFLDVQRGSGHPDTLDGNNDVNELVLAELLLQFTQYIEFIIIQGDDMIIAMRGHVIDVQSWEYEITRKFNLTIKLSIQEHGYICSYDIVHLPDGHSVVVADVIKRALAFLSMSKKNEEDFPEQFISFVDNMRYINDIRVQQYLARVLPVRLKPVLPNITSEAVLLLCKACSGLKMDYPVFRHMFSQFKFSRFY